MTHQLIDSSAHQLIGMLVPRIKSCFFRRGLCFCSIGCGGVNAVGCSVGAEHSARVAGYSAGVVGRPTGVAECLVGVAGRSAGMVGCSA